MKTCFYPLCEKTNFLKWVFLFLFIGTSLFHFVLSFEPAEKSSELSGSVTEEIVTVIEDVTNQEIDHDVAHRVVRKLVGHFLWFCVIGLFGTITFDFFFYKKSYVLGLILCIVTGFFIAFISELCQKVTSGRSCELKDMMIDYSGYLTSALILFIIDLVFYFITQTKKNKNI